MSEVHGLDAGSFGIEDLGPDRAGDLVRGSGERCHGLYLGGGADAGLEARSEIGKPPEAAADHEDLEEAEPIGHGTEEPHAVDGEGARQAAKPAVLRVVSERLAGRTEERWSIRGSDEPPHGFVEPEGAREREQTGSGPDDRRAVARGDRVIRGHGDQGRREEGRRLEQNGQEQEPGNDRSEERGEGRREPGFAGRTGKKRRQRREFRAGGLLESLLEAIEDFPPVEQVAGGVLPRADFRRVERWVRKPSLDPAAAEGASADVGEAPEGPRAVESAEIVEGLRIHGVRDGFRSKYGEAGVESRGGFGRNEAGTRGPADLADAGFAGVDEPQDQAVAAELAQDRLVQDDQDREYPERGEGESRHEDRILGGRRSEGATEARREGEEAEALEDPATPEAKSHPRGDAAARGVRGGGGWPPGHVA